MSKQLFTLTYDDRGRKNFATSGDSMEEISEKVAVLSKARDDCDRITEKYRPATPDQPEVDGEESDELREVNTTDGLFADFAAYVAQNPELRLWQALRNWSGYSKIYGEAKDGDLDDLFYQTTKGPTS